MNVVYTLWGGLALFGIIALLVMRAKEDKATRPSESAMNLIFGQPDCKGQYFFQIRQLIFPT
jgi:hypothetical protein